MTIDMTICVLLVGPLSMELIHRTSTSRPSEQSAFFDHSEPSTGYQVSSAANL